MVKHLSIQIDTIGCYINSTTQTVYPEDSSTLNSLLVMMAMFNAC